MARLTPSFCATLSMFVFASSPGIQAQGFTKYDEGPFAGMGYPYSESARVGDGLFSPVKLVRITRGSSYRAASRLKPSN